MTKPALTANGVFLDDTKIADAIEVSAGARRADDSTVTEVTLRTHDGRIVKKLFKPSNFLARNRTELKSQLADFGYKWPEDEKQSAAILQALAETTPKTLALMIQAPGWHGAQFQIGEETYGHSIEHHVLRVDPNTSAHFGSFLVSGELEDWRKHVARPAIKSPPVRVSISAGLAAVFLRPLGMNSFAINWFGPSSVGKTTCLLACASVSGFNSGGGLPGWADTEAGLEDQFCGHRDFAMALDETGDAGDAEQLKNKAKRLAFALGRNGPRKLAKTHEKLFGREARDYRVIVLSSSEVALSSVLGRGSKSRLLGEEVRLIDISATSETSHGIFNGKPGNKQRARERTRVKVDQLKSSCIRYQGHPIRAMMEAYFASPDSLSIIRKYKEEFEQQHPIDGGGAALRVRANFAVIFAAARFAIDHQILPWKVQATRSAIVECMRRALARLTPEVVSKEEVESRSTKQLLRALTKQVANSDIIEVKPREKVSAKQAIMRTKAHGFLVGTKMYVRRKCIEACCPAHDDRKRLAAKGIIIADRTDTLTVLKKIGGIDRRRYYCIDVKKFEAEQAKL